jgi:hypothetical protein
VAPVLWLLRTMTPAADETLMGRFGMAERLRIARSPWFDKGLAVSIHRGGFAHDALIVKQLLPSRGSPSTGLSDKRRLCCCGRT